MPEKCGPTSSAQRIVLAGCCGEGQSRQTLATSHVSGCLRQGVVAQSRNARLAESGERVRFLCLRLFCSSSLPRRAVAAPASISQGNKNNQVIFLWFGLNSAICLCVSPHSRSSPMLGVATCSHAHAPQMLGASYGFRETRWKDTVVLTVELEG